MTGCASNKNLVETHNTYRVSFVKSSTWNRRRVIEVAERIFLRAGFHRVSMDELAAELGMSKKTLYAHFVSKEALVEAVLKRRVSTMEAALEPLLKARLPFRQKFQRFAACLHDRMAEVSPLFLEDIRKHAPECFRIIEEFRGRAIPRYFGRMLEEGIRAGHLRGDLDRPLLVRLLTAAIQGIVRPEVINELRIHPLAALEGILDIVFQGILTTKGRRSHRNFSPS